MEKRINREEYIRRPIVLSVMRVMLSLEVEQLG